MAMITARNQQVPTDHSSLQSLQNQRGCLRESLVALSERLGHRPAQQKELIVMSLADVVGKWREIAPVSDGGDVVSGMFLSSQVLLDACYKNDPVVAAAKDTLGVILSSSKRVTCASLPDSVWMVDKHIPQLSASQLPPILDKALPFFAVWQAVFPGVRAALRTLHGTLDPALRISLASTSLGLYLPPVSLVRRAAGLPNFPTPGEDIEAMGRALLSAAGGTSSFVSLSFLFLF